MTRVGKEETRRDYWDAATITILGVIQTMMILGVIQTIKILGIQ